MKISADFKVDPQNELYASLPGEGADKEFPFAEISIKHLNMQDGTGKSALVNVADYKENLQLDVKEEIEIKGFKIGGAETGSRLPRKIELRLLANLDLVNAENNQTKLHLYLDQLVQDVNQKVLSSEFSMDDFKTHTEYATLEETIEHVFDFTYANGRLTHTFNGDADIVPGYFGWAGVLHDPLANLISGALKSADPALAETFLERYNHQSGGGIAGARYDFKGMVIDNLDMTAVINLVKGLFTPATSSEEGDPAPTEPTETVKEQNIYNGIIKAFTFLNSQGDGKFGIGLHGLLDDGAELLQYFGLSSIGTGEDAVPFTKAGLLPFLKNAVEGFMSMLTSDGLLDLDGCTPDTKSDVHTFIQKLEFLFGGEKDTEGQVTFDFDFTNGINWELYWLAQDNEEIEAEYQDVEDSMSVSKNKLINRGTEDVSIRYTSSIKFNETHEDIATDPFTDMFDKKGLYEAGIGAAQKALDDAKAAAGPKNTEYEKAKATYEATKEYKAYAAAQDAYTTQKAASLEILNSYKTESMWFTATIGKSITNLYYQGQTSNSTKALYKWVKAGEKKDESNAEYQAVKAIIDAALKALEDNKAKLATDPEQANTIYERWKKAWDMDGTDNLWTAHLAECKALIAQEDAKKTAEANDLTEYKKYKDAQSAKKTADKAVTDAQKAVDALEDPYFVYFYLDLATL